MISPYAGFISYQVNVDANGNNIVGDAANECAISVDPTNGNKMTIAWRQFNDVTSNFRQGGWGYTTDAGLTWTFPGVLQNNIFRSDPVTNSDETGQFFYLSLQSTWPTQTFYCDDLWRSTNGGQTWTEQSPDRSAGGDKAWFTIDKTGGPGHGFQYQIYDSANCFGSGVDFNAPPTAGLPGSRLSIFQMRPYTGLSMWIPTATFSLVVGLEAQDFAVCARAMHRSQARHPLLTETPLLTLVAACCILARLIPKAWLAKSSSRLTAPGVRLTTISICCAVCCRPGDRPPT